MFIAVEISLYLEYELRYTSFFIYFRLIAAIFDFQHTWTSESILASLSVLPDPENISTAVGYRCYRVLKLSYALCNIYFRLMAAIFDIPLIRTLGSLRSSLVVLPDSEIVGIAVGISLLSCIRAEAYVISYLLPVNGCHIRFSTYSDVGKYSHYSLRVA